MIPGFSFPVKNAPIVIDLLTSKTDFNVHEELGEPTTPQNVVVAVRPGATLSHSAADTFCFSTRGLVAGSEVVLVNAGAIRGNGGDGGLGIVVGRIFQPLSSPFGHFIQYTSVPPSGGGGRGHLPGAGGRGRFVKFLDGVPGEFNVSGDSGESGSDASYGSPVAQGGALGNRRNPGDVNGEAFSALDDGNSDSYEIFTRSTQDLGSGGTIEDYHAPFTPGGVAPYWDEAATGGDGGSCIEATVPLSIHQVGGYIFAGGGGGVGGNGFGSWHTGETDNPPYDISRRNSIPLLAWEIAHMLGGDGGDWGDAGTYGWMTVARQGNIYGETKYSPGAGGHALVKDNGIPVLFSGGSDDSGVFKGDILELP